MIWYQHIQKRPRGLICHSVNLGLQTLWGLGAGYKSKPPRGVRVLPHSGLGSLLSVSTHCLVSRFVGDSYSRQGERDWNGSSCMWCVCVFIPQPLVLRPLAIRLFSEEPHTDSSSEGQQQDGIRVSRLPRTRKD